MKKEIRQISKDGKTVQITIADERFYVKTEEDEKGNVISIKEYPSVTWKAGCYPKGVGYYMWLAKNGWDESQALMREAGNHGSRVHNAIESMLLGNEVAMDEKFPDSEGEIKELTLDDWEALMSFKAWHDEVNPESIAIETTVFNDEYNYAGTVDFVCKIDGELWIVDFKTSSDLMYEAGRLGQTYRLVGKLRVFAAETTQDHLEPVVQSRFRSMKRGCGQRGR